ncbi:MAG: hypothetical protein KIT72_16370 [Polyangiaceae bacterium]|nr:hypothetical protein [Polyangiaceae bacterium]MCW5791993.1 hypothetical protein [Polyangiaceae bacterium]
MSVPTEGEINVHGSLDEIVARDHFLNKSIDEGEALFRDNSAYYQEDLMWMGPRAFAFYLQSAFNYMKSDDATGDDHFVACILDVISFRRQEQEFVLAHDCAMELIAYVIDHIDKFAVDHDIYGNLLQKYEHLRSQLDGQT